MYKYLDIHTHRPSEDDVLSIINLRIGETPGKNLFSCGLHPMDIGKISTDKALEWITEMLKSQLCVAVGETGVDKLINIDVALQKKVFEHQLMIADKSERPVIIHNVRALPEILNSLKKMKFRNPFIFHGFTGKPETARQIVHAGGRLSFGKSIFVSHATRQTFMQIPTNSFFLETDEANCRIYDIYHEAAKLRNINLNELQKIVLENGRQIIESLAHGIE